jgi:hypothetical protein
MDEAVKQFDRALKDMMRFLRKPETDLRVGI